MLLKVVIRRARPSDLGGVVEVENLSFDRPYPPDLFYMFLLLHGDLFYVASVGGLIVGYVVATKRCSGVGHILSLAVRPEWRRRRIGSSLMKAVLEKLKSQGVDQVVLEVAVSNTRAIFFYESLGFQRTSVIKGYYPWGEDAYLMVKRLREDEH
ncbi:MAG: ribosomal-protein-alanine N-acetyltransferase [Thermoprotei archaeon]|nr:MAG: ribosomal-protein-alanine N-acetyltransferase [Thermoprotei archaeon]